LGGGRFVLGHELGSSWVDLRPGNEGDLLGRGAPQPRIDRFGPSILVDAGKQKLLFDCGRGATQRIEQLQDSLRAIDALFLTHLHSDHIVGIPDLWLTVGCAGRTIRFGFGGLREPGK